MKIIDQFSLSIISLRKMSGMSTLTIFLPTRNPAQLYNKAKFQKKYVFYLDVIRHESYNIYSFDH